ncbi:hypothetical protein BOW51_09575 [Solemya velesiana gill symbiont]|uniref:Sulfotransferase n=2 Tax=Solemya velesiana gill symbiont TaxID=1918948 RepID=A0A1T2KSV0_9GAMM|nr:hypothetical protein BOW51_09575 [Solemya velesiana gill symbiont]
MQAGQWAHAENMLQRLVKQQPKDAITQSNLGLTRFELGDDDEALRHTRRALKLNPKLAEAHNTLGKIYQHQQAWTEALGCYQKAISHSQENHKPYLMVNAGQMMQELGDLEGAEGLYRQVLLKMPGFLPAQSNLAVTLLGLGRRDEARDLLEALVANHPDSAEVYINLGTIRMDEGQQEPAKQCFEKAVRLDKGSALAQANLGYSLFVTGEQEQAVSHFDAALSSEPENVMALAGLGEALLRNGQLQEAEGLIRRAVQLGPNEQAAYRALTMLMKQLHDYEAAEKACRRYVELSQGSPVGYAELAQLYFSMDRYNDARAVYELAEQRLEPNGILYHAWAEFEENTHNLERAGQLLEEAETHWVSEDRSPIAVMKSKMACRHKNFDAALATLDEVDSESVGDKQSLTTYFFQKGYVLDKLEKFDEAFAVYRKAQEIKSDVVGCVFDPVEGQARFNVLKSVFSESNRQRFADLAKQLPALDLTPVFILGFPRAGTSLLEQILGAHAKFAPAGELTHIGDLATREAARIIGSDLPFPECLCDPEKPLLLEHINAMREYYLSRVLRSGVVDEGCSWVTDKMPHNSEQIGLIALLFPESPIIHISRHPLDNCLSAFFSDFTHGHRYTSSLESTAIQYQRVMDQIAHYKETVDMRYFEMRYQDLVDEQEGTVRRLLEFIGTTWDENCMLHHKSKRVVRTASYEQVTQKVYSSSLARHLNYWDEVQRVIPIVQPAIDRFGYSLK